MSKLDVRLAYQRETGLCLDTINNMAEFPVYSEDEASLVEYITWLEEKVDEKTNHSSIS